VTGERATVKDSRQTDGLISVAMRSDAVITLATCDCVAGVEEVLACLVNTLQSKPVAGLAGLISVKTESWNSRDGVVVRSHKSQPIGGRHHTATDTLSRKK